MTTWNGVFDKAYDELVSAEASAKAITVAVMNVVGLRKYDTG